MRMASLLGEEVGQTVGYRIRFDHCISSATRLEVLTEGILTRMIQQDNALEGVGLIIFDEFHERSLQADLGLALSREVQQILRDDLRIIIMSATLDSAELKKLLNNAPVLASKGRQYPIEYKYINFDQHVSLPQQVSSAIRSAIKNEEGDILAFLPGAGEIIKTADLLASDPIEIYTLYGDLSQKEQQAAIMPHPLGKRKLILATSIAETSLTIEGVKVVVDSGFSRVPRFDPRSGFTRLETIPVTHDTAGQRAGRAGRLGPGICYRLWAEGANHFLKPSRNPEIMEADLAPLALELANWGKHDASELAWLTPPPQGHILQAKELLTQLEALTENSITAKGKDILRLPTHPRIAHMLLESEQHGLVALAADIAALIEEKDILGRSTTASIYERLEVIRQWRNGKKVSSDRGLMERVERIAAQWRKQFGVKVYTEAAAPEDAGFLVALAYPERIAKKQGTGIYKLANGRTARLQDHDPLLNEEFLAIAQLDGNGRIYLAAPLNIYSLKHLYIKKTEIRWDDRTGVMIAQEVTGIGAMNIESKPLKNVSVEDLQSVVIELIRKEGLELFKPTDTFRQLQARIQSLKSWRSDEEWPDISEEKLIDEAQEWLIPNLPMIKKREDFERIDIYTLLRNSLPWEYIEKIDRLAPATITVPTGSAISLEYHADGSPPILAVRLQEMFGLKDTPTVNEGRTKVMLHLLSPAYRPVQVTQDLYNFWEHTYAEVRKELRMRYPKHSWPDDPWTAQAIRGAKKRNV
jgi:ATP-dependent helicase HrpB